MFGLRYETLEGCPLTNSVESLRQPRFVGNVLQRSARAFRTSSHCVRDARLTRSRFFWGGVSVVFPSRRVGTSGNSLARSSSTLRLKPSRLTRIPPVGSLAALCLLDAFNVLSRTHDGSSSGNGSSSDILVLQYCAVDHYRCSAATVASLRHKGNTSVF